MSRLKTLPARVQALPARVRTIQPGSWRADKRTAAERGYSYKWQQFRIRYLSRHPVCVMCEAVGRATAATVVDHVNPHRGDMTAFWRGPFQALCASCHSSTKQHEEYSNQ